MEDQKFPLLESILEEAAQAPLFHFTPLGSFLKIIKSNKLIPRSELKGKASFETTEPFIALTRNPNRTFVPGGLGLGIAFRLDREKLRQKFGKRVRPFAKVPLKIEELEPKDREEVLQARKTGDFSKLRGLSVSRGTSGSTDLEALAKGTVTRQVKFESEERIWGKAGIPNLKQFVTGIVLPSRFGLPLVKRNDVTAVAISFIWLSGAFSRDRVARIKAFEVRKVVLDAVTKFKAPIIFGGKEFSIGQVIRELKKLFALKKAKDPKLNEILDKYIGKNPSMFFELAGRRGFKPEK